MSDSLAGLAINVNVKQVNDAIEALDGLARKAGEVEKKVSNIGGGSAAKSSNDRAIREEQRVTREIEKVNKQQNAARRISAEQIISIERAKMNTLIANNERAFSAMNLAESRRLAWWQKFQDKINAGADKEAAANQKRIADISRFNGNFARYTEDHYAKLEASRKRNEAREAASNARSAAIQNAEQIRVERALQSSQNRLNSISGRAGRQLPLSDSRSVIAEATQAAKAYEAVVRSTGAAGTVFEISKGNFTRAMQNASSEITKQGGLLKTLGDGARTVSASFGAANASLGGFSRVMFSTSAALSSLAGAFALREITQSIMEFERFSNTLRTVSSSTQEYQQNLRFLYSEADRVGFSAGEVGNAFGRFSLAMSSAGFSTTQVRESFSLLTETSRNLGLSAADTTGVIRALEQSMSKGKFMAEEVRLQLGDRLPFAMAALTRAVTLVDGRVTDINKRFEEGSIDVARYGQEFINQLNQMSGGSEALRRTSSTLAAAFGRLGTEFSRATTYFGEAGFSDAVISFTTVLRRLLESLREFGALDVIAKTFQLFSDQLLGLGAAIAVVVGSLAASGLLAFFARLATTMHPIGRIVVGITSALSGLAVMWGSSAATAQKSTDTITRAARDAAKANETTSVMFQDAANVAQNGLRAVESSADSSFERLVSSLMRMGRSFSEANRLALEESTRFADAQAEATRNSLKEAERALQNYINARTNLGRSETQLDSNVRRATTGAYAVPQNYLDIIGQVNGVMAAVRAGSEPISALGVELEQIRQQAQGMFIEVSSSTDAATRAMSMEYGAVLRIIEDLLNSFRNLNTADLSGLRTQVDGLRNSLQSQLATATAFRNVLSTDVPVVMGPPAPPGLNLPIRDPDFSQGSSQRIRSAQTELLRRLTDMGVSGATVDGRRTILGAAPTPTQTLAYVRQNRNTPQIQQLLTDYEKSIRDAPGGTGARGSVGEAVRDLQLQAGRAGNEGGTADAAYADALRRVRDAATNARESVAALREEELARQAVAERLNKEMELAIRLMVRETKNNIRLANAYMQSSEAGRQMEVTIRAEAEARKYARERGVEYTEALRIMTARVNDLVNSERQLAMGRQVDQGRKDIEVLELEGRLITANVSSRNAEVAVLRTRQEFVGQDTSIIEAQIRRTEELRSRNEQLTNSWTEVSRLGEQAFERIGSAITEALAQGRIEGISFKNVMKAVFSEVAQAALKLSVINPILNAAFGGTRGTISGAFTAAGLSNNVSSAFGGSGNQTLNITDGGGNIIGQLGNLSNGRTLTSGLSGNLGSFFPGGSAVNTGFSGVDSILNASIYTPSTAGSAFTSSGFAAGTALPGEAGAFIGGGGGGASSLSFAQALGPVASIAGGAYGVYSGLQRGGPGGYTSAAGGAISMTSGAALLGLLGPGLAALGPAGLAVGALLAIGGSLLPGAKPSSMGQEARIELATGDISRRGLTGDRYSKGNASQAEDAVQNIATLAGNLSAALGGLSLGNQAAAVGVTRNTLYLDAVGQKAQFSNSEEGAKELAKVAGQFLIDAFTDVEKRNIAGEGRAGSDRLGILINSNRDVETLSANLQWYDNVFKKLTETAEKTSQFAQSLESTKQPFDEAITKAQQLGVAEGELIRKRDEATAKLTAERDRQVLGIREGLSLRGINSGAVGGDRGNLLYWANLRENARLAVDEIEELRNTLESLGISASEVNVEIGRLQAIQAAEVVQRQEARANSLRSFDENLNLRGYRASGATQTAALYEFDIAAVQEIKDAKTALENLGLGASDVTSRIVRMEQIIAEERTALLKQYQDEIEQQRSAAAQSVTSTLGNLRNYVRSLSFSEASILDPASQYALATNQFNTVSARALQGDTRSINDLQSYSEQLLSSGRSMFGSGAEYATLFQRVIGTLEGVVSIDEDTLTVNAMAQIQEASTETLAAELQAIRAELVALRSQTAQQQATPARA